MSDFDKFLLIYLDNMDVEPEKLPFWARLKVYWDFSSQIKHIWIGLWLLRLNWRRQAIITIGSAG